MQEVIKIPKVHNIKKGPSLKWKFYRFTKDKENPGSSIICNFNGKLFISLAKQIPGQNSINPKTKNSVELSTLHIAKILDILERPNEPTKGMAIKVIAPNLSSNMFMLMYHQLPLQRLLKIGIAVIPETYQIPNTENFKPEFGSAYVEISLINEQITCFKYFLDECLRASFYISALRNFGR